MNRKTENFLCIASWIFFALVCSIAWNLHSEVIKQSFNKPSTLKGCLKYLLQ